ncbi:hypothetical protein [Actinoplanes sp. NPDC049681]|uniref:hypothetical protein n=1 Tax=Actinoplanes sp. NPDC049681 TaxID=3363905 RepID=UPI0037BCC4EA
MSDKKASTSNNDAIWVVESTDFVTPYAPLKGSMFDDADRLRAAWRLTMASFERDAGNAGTQDRIVEILPPDDPATTNTVAGLERQGHDVAPEQPDPSAAPTPEPGEKPSGSMHLVRTILAWLLRRPRVDPAS